MGWGSGELPEALTLGVSVVSVGDTAEPLLPCGVPDLGREGQTVRSGQALCWAEKTLVVVPGVGGERFLSLVSQGPVSAW